MKASRTTVIFDLGGVLIDWNPRHLYRKLFVGDERAMEEFLTTVCTQAWNVQQDAGRSFAEGAAILKARHPEKAALIDAFGARFGEMMAGEIAGSVAILDELHRRGVPLFALSNWSRETFPFARERFAFLERFSGIVISGEIGHVKPDPAIYRHLLDRFGIDPGAAVFIDDVAGNAEAARAFGIHPVHFTSPPALERELRDLRLL
ncbi:MAG TPA: HAD family phosphatase [Stellaceae bacterium]|nr:HAD family phosphatase [Stellaceae bacterium]